MMELRIIILLILKFYSIFCDLDDSIDPIDQEYYKEVVDRRIVKQQIAKAIDGKIVGGLPAVLGQFDYFVIVYGQNKKFLCGGTLIKVNWVLTAGHCLYEMKNVEVHFGIVNRLRNPERLLKIEDDSHLIVHENYDSNELFNDIALIYLEKMSSLWLESSSIGFIEPKLYDCDLTNQTTSICGFGRTSDESGASYYLNYINIPIMDYKQCEVYYYLDENNICVSTKSGESPCNGDSGGGVVVTTEDNQKILVGIVSFGTFLCTINYPVVLTKVSNYIDWMEDKFKFFENPTTTLTVPTLTTEDGSTLTTPNSAGSIFMKKKLSLMILTTLMLVKVILKI